ncbi:hypothetical protein BK138_21905 [Paenibacillus rhizosphaerae]|uniref:Uncharacterized protein n=1 Tax=Paenibacillus rhizosphaerae TaxID=297318 RepID=A0A1R1ELQ0_9BACL|nr:hypothetical protein BK138_21905 [Paenibacillus rhizosphaerae]OXL86099.1 hypothetical protein BCV73_25725 [Paenibacillus sp. SSG-1]
MTVICAIKRLKLHRLFTIIPPMLDLLIKLHESNAASLRDHDCIRFQFCSKKTIGNTPELVPYPI